MDNPSKEQLAVKEALLTTSYNLFISATAGSGKTTTLVWLLSFLQNKTVLCCAFNKDIKEELAERCKIYPNVKVSTLHALGYSMLKKEYGCDDPDGTKYRKIFVNMSPKWTLPDDKDFGGRVLQLVDLLRLCFVKNMQEALDVAKLYNISNVDHEVEIALEVIEAGRSIVTNIDFTDMIYLPVFYNLTPRTKYQVLCIDEVQDLNKLQRMFIFKFLAKGGRFIAVGDKFQCQPAGTMIQMNDGSVKPIEQIKKGDKLVSYNSYTKTLTSRTINEIASRTIDSSLFKININGKISKYTDNHYVYVKYKPEIINSYCIYLMEDGKKFRIGRTKLVSSNGTLGFVKRTANERAINCWVLKIVDSKEEANFWEKVYSVKYHIPDVCFHSSVTSKISQEKIDKVYENFPYDKLKTNARNLLADLGLDINYPLYVRGSKLPCGYNELIVTHAANIDPTNMMMGVLESKSIIWYPILCMDREVYFGKVYSLDVDVDHNYIADGILCGNCIYAFMGSDVKSFSILQNSPNTKLFPLSVTYRCPKAVVRYLGKYNNEIKAWENAPEGVIEMNAQIEDIKSSDMILCRNNMPLAKLCMQFLSKGVKAYIRGRDIGENLVKLIQKTKKSSVIDAIKWLSEDLQKMKEKMMRIHRLPAEDIEEMSEFVSMQDKIDTLKAITYGCLSVDDAIGKIKRIFADDKREGIMLSTIHKAKGLEAKNVFIVCDWLMPSKFAKTDIEKEQENNIQFVAYSRTKYSLNFIDKETFDPYKKEKKVEYGNENPYGRKTSYP